MKKSLPRLKIDLQNILLRADGLQGVITYPSDIQSTGYAASTESVLIISGEMGYLGIREENIDTLIEELSYIKDEMKRRRRDAN